jgi:hypothetical protein
MENIYKPYRYLFSLAKKIPHFTIICTFLCWLPTLALNAFLMHQVFMPLIRFSLVLNLTVFFIALLFSMVLHEVCGTTYAVSDTAIVKKSPYKTSLLHFENVTRFLYVRLPMINGFGLIKVPNGSIRLPFIIDNLDDCIEDIRRRLANCGRLNAYDHRNIEEFKCRAVVNGISVHRMQRTIRALFQIVIGSIAQSAFIAQFFWEMPLKWVLSWTLIGAVLPVIAFVTAEMILNYFAVRKARCNAASLLAESGADGKDELDESLLYWRVGAITAIIYVAAGIVFKSLVAGL